MPDEEFDDLRILANEGLARSGEMTLCALARNEMYFLPAFLDHYRALGIGRFVILDDQSDDGTREFLAAQADVLLLASDRRYGDTFTASTGPLAGRARRMVHVWKTLMMQKFCLGHWALCVDADEFILLPPGWRFPDLVAKLPTGAAPAITGVMLDAYPAQVSDLKTDAPFDPMAEWYVDGQRHAVYRPAVHEFRMLHSGVRARLMHRMGLIRGSRLQRLKRLLRDRSWYPRANEITKIVLMNWEAEAAFLSSHSTTQAVNPNLLLPILHFKFTPDLYRRTRVALAEGQYYNGSAEYRLMAELLTRMEAAGGSFLYRKSHKARDFEALRRSGNALLP